MTVSFSIVNGKVVINSLNFAASKEKKVRENKGNSLIEFPSNFVVVDLETTGLDPTYNHIIEIACLRVENLQITDSYSSLVHYSGDLDSFITELSGITSEMLQEQPKLQEILPIVKAFIGDSLIVGHNVNFDINFLYDSFERHMGEKLENSFVDTMRLSRRILPELKHHRLSDIVQHYNIGSEAEHRALGDCKLTFECYLKLRDEVIASGGIEQFIEKCKAKSKQLDLRTVQTEKTEFDENHILYGKHCCFTGTLERMTRAEAAQLVVDLGGLCDNGVTKKTNFLVLGNTDYSVVKDGKSNKQKTAEKYKLAGLDIEVISEDVFYDLVLE